MRSGWLRGLGCIPSTNLADIARSRSATWLYRVHRVLQVASRGHASLRVYLFCAQPVDGRTVTTLRPQRGVELREVKADDAVLATVPRPRSVVAQRFASGARCFVLTVENRFAAMGWLSSGTYDEDEVRCTYRLPVDTASVWDFDIYVEPEFRSGRTMARLWYGILDRLRAEGTQWSFSRISLFNQASLQAHERLGAVTVGHGLFLRLGSLQISMLGGPCPRLHLGWGPVQRPTVDLRPPEAAALVLGADSHALAVTRALADAGIAVYTLRKNPPLPGAFSNRPRASFPVPRERFARFDDEMVPVLIATRRALRAHPTVALVAINDRQVATIGRHLDTLLPHFRIAWADRADMVLHLQRKDALEARCQQVGLNYPCSAVFKGVEDATLAASFRFPIIIKPVRPLSSFKTLIASDPEELRAHLAAHPADLPILGQEYVVGDDSNLYFGALLLDRGRVVHGLVGRKIASFPPARGQTTIAETADEPEVLRLAERFFDGLGLTGPVSLELKRDAAGRWWVIEPTVGRTDFWAGLCIGAGFNQPLMNWQLATGRSVTPPRAPLHRCVWYDTEREPLGWLKMAWRERRWRPRRARQYFPYWGHSDPLPLIISTIRAVWDRLVSAWARLRGRHSPA